MDRTDIYYEPLSHEQKMVLFAEKAAMRFSLKELAGTLDTINQVLCQQSLSSDTNESL